MTISERRPMNKVSPKQRKEYALRARVKAKLLLECETDAGGFPLCPQCGQVPDPKDGRGELHLCHEIPLSQGGRTSYRNCYLACRVCHNDDHAIPEEPVRRIVSDSLESRMAALTGHYQGKIRAVSIESQVGIKERK